MKPGSPAPASPPLHAGLGHGLCPCSVPHPRNPHSPGKPVCFRRASGPAWDLAEVMVTLSFPTVDTRGQTRTFIGHLPSQPHSHQRAWGQLLCLPEVPERSFSRHMSASVPGTPVCPPPV